MIRPTARAARSRRAALTAAALLALPSFARAYNVDHYFVGPPGSLFSDPANWSTSPTGPGGSPPASQDNAVANRPGLSSLTLDAAPGNVSLATLTFTGSPSSPLAVTHTGSLSAMTTLIGPHTAYTATGSAYASFYPVVDGPDASLSLDAPSGNYQFHQGASVGPSAGGSLSLSAGYAFLEHPLTFGGSAGTAAGLISGGTLSGSVRLDSAAHATVTQTGGAVTSSALLGRNASYTLSGGSLRSVSFASKDPYAPPLSVPTDHGATFVQTGGSVTGTVNVTPYSPTSPALYALSGGTLTNNSTLTVASAYAATFLQTGGTVGGGPGPAPGTDPVAVYLGRVASPGTPSTGTYSLSSTGQLFTARLSVGTDDHGTFAQSGGAVTLRPGNVTPLLSLGSNPGSSGSYALSAGSLTLVGPNALLAVGDAGAGTFSHTGGSVSFPTGGELRVANAAGSTGAYSLSSPASLSTPTLTVAYAGRGAFDQSGGTTAPTFLYLGYNPGSSGAYSLSAGSLSVANALYAGYSGSGTLSVSGGVASLPNLHLAENSGSTASLSLTGGTLTSDFAYLGDAGAASVTHSAGTFTVNGTLTLANSYSSSASYALSGTASLHAGRLVVGAYPSADASFSQSGGTVSLHALSIPPATPDATHAYTLSAGTLTVSSSGTSASTLRSYLHDGRLTSPPTDPSHRLAYTTTGSTLTISLALTGDANLDGSLTPDDYALLDRSYARALPSAFWTDGDFNYDGTIDQNDYLLLDTAFYQTHPLTPAFLSTRESQFGPAYVSTLLAAVPEPASLAPLILLLPFARRGRT